MTGPEVEPAQSILTARARALARPLERTPEGDELPALAFSIRSEAFVIEASFVREVVGLRAVVGLPGAPQAVRGLTTYRGEILPAIDLGAVVGLPGGGLGAALWLIVLGTEAAEFGLLADEIAGVTRVRADDLRPLPEDAAPAARRLARGITADAATLLDGAALLAATDLFMTPTTPPAGAADAEGRE